METRSIQQRVRCPPTIMEKPERLSLSPILSYNESSEKRSNRHGHNDSNNASLAKPTQYLKAVSLDLSAQHYCSYRSATSAYHEAFGSFTVGKHPHITNLMTGIFNNRRNLKDYAFPPICLK